MGLPPIQTIDHEPVHVLQQDSAWDRERIDLELKILKGELVGLDPGKIEELGELPWGSSPEHPYIQYHTGQTRCDLTLVEEYLREDEGPVRFHLRRLKFERWIAMRDRIDESPTKLQAIRYGLVSVEGVDAGIRKGTGPLKDADLQRLMKLVGDSGLFEIADMIASVTAEITAPEKKPLGS